MPGPRRFTELTCVGRDARPFSSGLLVRYNEPIRQERKFSWQMHLHQQPANPRFQTSMPGMSATKAKKAFGPKLEPLGPTAMGKGFRSNWIFFRSTVESFFASQWTRQIMKRARERPFILNIFNFHSLMKNFSFSVWVSVQREKAHVIKRVIEKASTLLSLIRDNE